MARKNSDSQIPPPLPELHLPLKDAENLIQLQIDKGSELLSRTIRTETEYEQFSTEVHTWSEVNKQVLRRLTQSEALLNDYGRFSGLSWRGGDEYTSQSELIEAKFDDVKHYISQLKAIHARLPHFSLALHIKQQSIIAPQFDEIINNRQVFIVHGHDDAAKLQVARFVEKLGLIPIILHEQPGQGRTIIEKFENYANVGFAIVILTPDDVGSLKLTALNLQDRARQNVVFELGFFIGKLGRNRVCPLVKGTIEVPSDYLNVEYHQMEKDWQLKVAGEMKAAGLDADLNRLYSQNNY